MKLIIATYDIIKGKEKEIELYLKVNFDNKNDVIKDLINKYSIMEKEIKELKDDKKKMKEENDKLNKKIENLEIELNTIKYNKNNEIEILSNQANNCTNMINQIYQKLDEFNNLKEEINTIKNKINSLDMSTNNSMLTNQYSSYYNKKILNNTNKVNNNNMGSLRENNDFLFDKKFEKSENKDFLVKFRESINDGKSNVYSIKCNKSEKIKDLIERYRLQANNFSSKIKFIYNAKVLNEDHTVDEAGLSNNCNIFVVFVDLRKLFI